MTLGEMRAGMEAFRGVVDRDGEARRDSCYALEQLYAMYLRLDAAERSLAKRVLSEWALSSDERLRFDALTLIDDFNVTEAIPSLQELELRLGRSHDPGAPYERQKVRRIMRTLGHV